MVPSISRSRFSIFMPIAFVYAIIAGFLLLKIHPGGGLYGSWDTTRFLVLYLLLSFIYLIWIAKFLKIPVKFLIPSGIIVIIIFSLGFSLIRLSGALLDLTGSLKPQNLYYLSFFLTITYALFYSIIKIIYSTILAFRKRSIEFPILYYLMLHCIALMPYFAYMVIKNTSSKALLLVAVIMGLYGLITLIFRNPLARQNLRNLLSFLWGEKRYIFLIFIFALAVRTLFAIQLTKNLPAGFMEGPDSLAIDEEVRHLLETGDIFSDGKSFLSQKGSMVLSYVLIYKAFGYNPLYARFFNALLGASCVIFTFFIAKFLLGSLAAKIAAFLTAGYGYLIQYGTYIGSEALGLFAVELFVLAILIAKQKEGVLSRFWTFLSGLSFAICIMARPEYHYFLIIAFLWVIYIFRQKKINIFYFAVGFIIVGLPWAYRNLVCFGEFTLSSLISSQGQEKWLSSLWNYEILEFSKAGLPVSKTIDMFFYFFSHPGVSAKIILPHILKGAYNFWDYNAFFTPAFIFIQPRESPYNLILCFYLYYFMFAGFFISRRKWDTAMILLFLLVFKTISYAFSTSPNFLENGVVVPLFKDWYRFTVVPFTHVFMGGGIASLISKAVKSYEHI